MSHLIEVACKTDHLLNSHEKDQPHAHKRKNYSKMTFSAFLCCQGPITYIYPCYLTSMDENLNPLEMVISNKEIANINSVTTLAEVKHFRLLLV